MLLTSWPHFYLIVAVDINLVIGLAINRAKSISGEIAISI